MKYNLRQFREAAAPHIAGLIQAARVLVWNTRWNFGYRIGGFTSAYRRESK